LAADFEHLSGGLVLKVGANPDLTGSPNPANSNAVSIGASTSERIAELDSVLVRGIAWTGGIRWTSHLLTWAGTLLVARLLSPGDFGVWAMAGVYLGVVNLLSEFGLAASVVALPRLTRGQISQIAGFALAMGIAACLLSCILAWPLAFFFRTPALAPVIVAMSITFVIASIRSVPLASLQKAFRFKPLAVIDGIRVIIHTAAIVTFAFLGLRYWSLVLGALVSETIWTLMVAWLQRPSIARPRTDSIQEAIRFSMNVGVSRLCWYLYSNADFMVAGRLLGQAPLGAYSLGWSMASVPVDKVSSLVLSVTPALFSAVSENLADLRRYVLTLTEGISLIAFPASVGLVLTANDFVAVALGSHWESAVLPLQILAAYMFVRCTSPLLVPVLNVLGQARIVTVNNVLTLLILPPAFVVGSRWGTAGIAAAWLVAHPIPLAILYVRTFRRMELSASSYLRSLWPALSSTAGMAFAVLLTRLLNAHSTAPQSMRLVVEIVVGAASYLAILLIFHRDRVGAFRRVLTLARVPAS
jgi:PST family polysaccharide transporter